MTESDLGEWIALRDALWPNHEPAEHETETRDILGNPDLVAFAARDGATMIGFAEASLRRDYVNGCDSSPVTFLEGIYVRPEHRRKSAARLLVDAVAAWGRANGCSELASDAGIANVTSHQMHEALGFSETQRVVFFRKSLD